MCSSEALAASIDPIIIEGWCAAMESVRLKCLSHSLRAVDVATLRLASAYFVRAAENEKLFSPLQKMVQDRNNADFSPNELNAALAAAEKIARSRGVFVTEGQITALSPQDHLSKSDAVRIISKSPTAFGAELDGHLQNMEKALQNKSSSSYRAIQSATPGWCYDANFSVLELAAIAAIAGLACALSEGTYAEACATAALFAVLAAMAAMAVAEVCNAH